MTPADDRGGGAGERKGWMLIGDRQEESRANKTLSVVRLPWLDVRIKFKFYRGNSTYTPLSWGLIQYLCASFKPRICKESVDKSMENREGRDSGAHCDKPKRLYGIASKPAVPKGEKVNYRDDRRATRRSNQPTGQLATAQASPSTPCWLAHRGLELECILFIAIQPHPDCIASQPDPLNEQATKRANPTQPKPIPSMNRQDPSRSLDKTVLDQPSPARLGRAPAVLAHAGPRSYPTHGAGDLDHPWPQETTPDRRKRRPGEKRKGANNPWQRGEETIEMTKRDVGHAKGATPRGLDTRRAQRRERMTNVIPEAKEDRWKGK
ncbi:hypothetical protein BKA70DRAFT_1398573 [Coprinopsis sp. MPI-PUGE-AT-0042]|nr:hypothetical protein BKA70DRAFT_1398573 [Coprinopsis sp. MPI-PUGE-AT-0042]